MEKRKYKFHNQNELETFECFLVSNYSDKKLGNDFDCICQLLPILNAFILSVYSIPRVLIFPISFSKCCEKSAHLSS